MFESVVTKLVKAFGSDSYLPSPSLLSSEELSPLSLIERKASRWYFGKNTYYTSEFQLSDVLQKTDTPFKTGLEPEKDVGGFTKNAVLKLNGKLAGHFRALFDAELDNVSSVTVKADLGELHQVEADLQSLLDNVKTRRLDMNHELIREMSAKDRRALCVVTGVIKTTKETLVVALLNFKVNASAKVDVAASSVDAEADGGLEANRSRTMKLPAGTVLAYEVKELSVDKKGSFRVMVSHDSKGGFNSSDVDVTDAKPSYDMSVSKESLRTLYSGFALMKEDERKALLSNIKSLCGNKALIEQLAVSLRTDAVSHESPDIQSAIDLVNKQHDKKQASTAVLSLLRALKNLDIVLLNDISLLTADQVHLLSEILSTCHTNAVLPRSSAPAADLLSRDDSCMAILFDELMFNLTEKGLSFSKENSVLVNSAYMAFYAFNLMY